MAICKSCNIKFDKTRPKAVRLCPNCFKEYFKNYSKEHRAKNKEHYKEYRYSNYRKNLTKTRERNREYSKKYRSSYVPRSVKYNSNRTIPYADDHQNKLFWYFRNLRNGKKKLDYELLIKLWNTQNGLCAVSGLQMVLERHNLKSASVDRIDSSIGYEDNNIQLVCKWVNFAKNDASNSEIVAIINELRSIQ